MSFSEPKLQNPATKFIDFKDGKFVYYDKEIEKNVTIDLPIYFVVLDELSTISGYCEKHSCGIYSNEVHRITDEILNVRTFKGGEQIIGLYKDISDSVARIGGKFTKSVYALLIDTTNPSGSSELVNFRFRGAAFSAWLDKKFNAEKYAVGIMETYEATKGKTVYQVPVFKQFNIKPDLVQIATNMDKQLQSYLRAYKANQAEKETKEEITTEHAEEVLPSSGWMSGASKTDLVTKAKAAMSTIEDDLPFN